jgi:hypothetical protein
VSPRPSLKTIKPPAGSGEFTGTTPLRLRRRRRGEGMWSRWEEREGRLLALQTQSHTSTCSSGARGPRLRVSTRHPPHLPWTPVPFPLPIPHAPHPGPSGFGIPARSPRRRQRLLGGAGRLGGWEAGDAGGLCKHVSE